MRPPFAALIALTLTLALSSGGLTPAAYADNIPLKKFNLTCVTAAGPTTSFVASTKDGQVLVSLLNHQSPEFMPIYYGNITPSDLPELTQRAALLKQAIGERIDMTFSLANCVGHGGGVFSCFRGTPVQQNGFEIAIQGFFLGTQITHFQEYEFERREATLALVINGKLYTIAMSYEVKECELDVK